MKKIFKLFVLPLAVLTACVDSLDDYNIDKKRAASVPAETLYTAALKSVADNLITPNVNINNFRLYVQHWSTTQYLDEPRYVLTARLIPQNFWDATYRDGISDLREAKRILEADALINPVVKQNQLAQLEIFEIYCWTILVNTFGNVPYSQALDVLTPLPQYDDAETIYRDLMARLDVAIGNLNPAAAGFGAGELLYASKAAAQRIPTWIRFANSLKLRMAMTVIEHGPMTAMATTAIQQAAPNVITSSADNARFPYIADPPNNNPVSQNLNATFTARKDFVGAKPFVDKLNALNDPRRPHYFNTVPGTTNYVGGNYGYTNNPVANYSEISDKAKAANYEGLLLDYSEVSFLLAEAVERGIIAGSAETHYNNAVRASILYWGGTDAQATAYLAQPDVAYATAGANYKEKIGTQKWIALFGRGWDAWNEWKRLDYPVLVTPNNATPPAGQTAPATDLKIPTRIIYPITEQNLNTGNREAAASAMGGDLATVKIFWDKN